MTRQEIFTAAVRGLASQGWDRCECPRGTARYAYDSRRSPWGWVDLSLDKNIRGSVYYLRQESVGLAASASDDLLAFANRMELAHDLAPTSITMRRRFRNLAFEFSLHWPDDVP